MIACGGSPQAGSSPKPSPSCTGTATQEFDVTSADGFTRRGAAYGSGPTVIISHQSDQTRCDVVSYALWLRDSHYQAVVVDLGGDWTGVLAATVKAMRDRGATSVQLLGASMGGCVAMIVGSQVSPAVSAVVSLGGERNLGGGYDADAAVARSHVPLFVVTSENDGYLTGDEARALIGESASKDKHSLILAGDLHGFAMLDGPDSHRVRQAVLDFLSAHAG
jgi:hypothetical protein